MASSLLDRALNYEATICWGISHPTVSPRRLWQIYKVSREKGFWGTAMMAIALLHGGLGDRARGIRKLAKARQEVEEKYARVRARRDRSVSRRATPLIERGEERWTRGDTTPERFTFARKLAGALTVEGPLRRRKELRAFGSEALAAGWPFEAYCATLFEFAACGLSRAGDAVLRDAHQRLLALEEHPEVVVCRNVYLNPVSDVVHLARTSRPRDWR